MSNNSKPHPNPFDFVAFSEKGPNLWSKEVLDAMGKPISGYLELTLTALTPVHVAGTVTQGKNKRLSYFMEQNGQPCIPAATIRGCLRTFIEALTNGWVSQADEEYPKVNGKRSPGKGRHIGFRTFEPYEIKYGGKKQTAPSAIDPNFKPQAGNKLDIASYLFGIVVESDNSSSNTAHEDLARKSKIWIEDAFVNQNLLTDLATYHVPDIAGSAFMGGGKPSASSWWYFYPSEIQNRRINLNGRLRETAEFVGEKFRGRKFYFHQDPVQCIRWYEQNWDYGDKYPEPVFLQAIETKQSTHSFRIYFDEVPDKIMQLLMWTLLPGEHIKHKLGYGKAYGYGSVQFSLERALLRYPGENRIPASLQDLTSNVKSWSQTAWDEEKIEALGPHYWIDWDALNQLAKILTWDNQAELVFTYPPFVESFFKQPVAYNHPRIRPATSASNSIAIPDETTGKRVAMVMYLDQTEKRTSVSKKTIDFRVYQEQSLGWDIIERRRP